MEIGWNLPLLRRRNQAIRNGEVVQTPVQDNNNSDLFHPLSPTVENLERNVIKPYKPFHRKQIRSGSKQIAKTIQQSIRASKIETTTPAMKESAESSNQQAQSSRFEPTLEGVYTLDAEGSHDNPHILEALLAKWHQGSSEDQFSSFALYSEVKIQEARRLEAWLQKPNRFFTSVCFVLLAKFAGRLGSTGHTLRVLLHELLPSVFHSAASAAVPGNGDKLELSQLQHLIPYYVEYHRVKQACFKLIEQQNSIENKATSQESKGISLESLQSVISGSNRVWQYSLIKQVFYQWYGCMKRKKKLYQFISKMHRHQTQNIAKDIFRQWRIEALRKSYFKESADYQSMLSVTAETLNRKV